MLRLPRQYQKDIPYHHHQLTTMALLRQREHRCQQHRLEKTKNQNHLPTPSQTVSYDAVMWNWNRDLHQLWHQCERERRETGVTDRGDHRRQPLELSPSMRNLSQNYGPGSIWDVASGCCITQTSVW